VERHRSLGDEASATLSLSTSGSRHRGTVCWHKQPQGSSSSFLDLVRPDLSAAELGASRSRGHGLVPRLQFALTPLQRARRAAVDDRPAPPVRVLPCPPRERRPLPSLRSRPGAAGVRAQTNFCSFCSCFIIVNELNFQEFFLNSFSTSRDSSELLRKKRDSSGQRGITIHRFRGRRKEFNCKFINPRKRVPGHGRVRVHQG